MFRVFLFFVVLSMSFSVYSRQFTPVFNNLDQAPITKRILDVKSDKKGFIWLASQIGLFRYDGYDFKVYLHNLNDPLSIPDNYVSSILVTREDQIWIATDKGVAKYLPASDSFQRIDLTHHTLPENPSKVITKIAEGSDGNLWIGTWGLGLIHFDVAKNEVLKVYKFDESNDKSIGDNRIYSIVEDPKGYVWVGTRDGGLTRLTLSTNSFIRYQFDSNDSKSLSHNRVYSLLVDSKNKLWIGTRGGGLNLFDYETESFNHIKDSNGKHDGHIMAILEDDKGNIWLGTDGEGLQRLNPESFQVDQYINDESNTSSLSSNKVWSLTQGKQGLIWLSAFEKGISSFDPKDELFGFVNNNSGNALNLTTGAVKDILIDSKDQLWIATTNGLNKRDKEAKAFEQFIKGSSNKNSLSNNDVKVIFEDSKKNVWIGTKGGGLNLYNQHTMEFQSFSINTNKANESIDYSVYSIIEDSNLQLWVGTGNGLYKIDLSESKYHLYHLKQVDLPLVNNSFITTLHSSLDGRLWIGTSSKGIITLQTSDMSLLNIVNNELEFSLTHNRVLSFASGKGNILWIGTLAGLNKFDTKTNKFMDFGARNILINNPITELLSTDDHELWGGSDGLFFINDVTGKIKFDIGKSAGCINVAQGSFFKSNSNTLFFGQTGFCHFSLNDVSLENEKSELVFTDFLLFNQKAESHNDVKDKILDKSIDFVERITLTHLENVFSIKFALLNHKHPQKAEYQYMMKGMGEKWFNSDSDNRTANFTGLPPGRYQFRARGKSLNGEWSDIKKVDIIITPPFWRTWWAYSFYVALVLLIFLYLISKQRKKTAYEKEQTRKHCTA